MRIFLALKMFVRTATRGLARELFPTYRGDRARHHRGAHRAILSGRVCRRHATRGSKAKGGRQSCDGDPGRVGDSRADRLVFFGVVPAKAAIIIGGLLLLTRRVADEFMRTSTSRSSMPKPAFPSQAYAPRPRRSRRNPTGHCGTNDGRRSDPLDARRYPPNRPCASSRRPRSFGPICRTRSSR